MRCLEHVFRGGGGELGRKGKESLPLKHPMVTRSRVKRKDRARRIGIAFRVNLPRLETRITKLKS